MFAFSAELKKISFTIISILICAFLILGLLSTKVFAQTTQPVQISINNLTAGNGAVTASLEIQNPNSVNLTDLLYTARILSQDKTQVETVRGREVTSILPGILLSDQTSDNFSLSANGTKSVSLNLPYSASVPGGKHNLTIALFSKGTLLGSRTAEVNLNGTGSMLQINSCLLVVDNVEYDSGIGPNVAPKGEILAKCNVTNPANFDQIVFPSGEYAVDTVQGNKTGTSIYKAADSITFEANAAKTVTFALPALEKPQVYEALIAFTDSAGNIVSPKTAFRWVVAGESANLRSVSTDKSAYKSGETAKVVVGADPSMDLFWNGGGPTKPVKVQNINKATFTQPKQQGTPLKNPAILVSIKDQNGEVCGTLEQKVEANPEQNNWQDQTLNVPITKNCQYVTVEAAVKNDGQVLAQKEVKVAQFKAEKSATPQNRNTILAVLISGSVLIIVGIALWLYKRRKTNLPPPTSQTPPMTTIPMWLLTLGAAILAGKMLSLGGITLIPEAHAANQSIRVGYNQLVAYRDEACPGPDWKNQPQRENGNSCLLEMISSVSWTTFNMLDTSNEINFSDGKINAHLSGQFVGEGCVNAQVGLIIKAYVNGSQEGVKINGIGPRVEFPNLAANGGGSGTPFDKNISIESNVNKCGPLDVKIEMIPFIDHVGRVASVRSEDQLITDAEVPGWKNVTYRDRANCGGNGDCSATIQKNIDAGPCVQCGETCNTANDCRYAANGCTACLPAPGGGGGKTCQPPISCGHSCASNLDCAEAINGCTYCIPNMNGQGSSCQTQPKCGDPCVNPASCQGAQNGCTSCINDGSGAKCGTCPAGLVYDPTQLKCVCPKPGETNPHGVCDGDKCTQVASCGVNDCTTDKQCFAEEMCKCDGFEATQLEYPSTKPFSFDAFAKIEGTDIAKAIVEGIQFRMSESDKTNPNSGTIIAQSPMYTPQIVSQSGQKVRYKATWSMTPPVIKANKMYRVFAEIKCKPKNARRVANAADPRQVQSTVLGVGTVHAAEGDLEVARNDLQLKTLNMVKKGQTDSCRFLFFEYDAGLY